MSGREKGKQPMSGTPDDPPEVSGFAPGAMDLEGDGDFDDIAALLADNDLFTSLSMPGWVPYTTTATGGNAYEQEWNQIRPDRDTNTPQGLSLSDIERGNEQLGAPPIDASNDFSFGGQGQDASSFQIPLEIPQQPPTRPPPLSRSVPDLRQTFAPTSTTNTFASPLQASSANIFSAPPRDSQGQSTHDQTSGPSSSRVPQIGPVGHRSFSGVADQGSAAGTQQQQVLAQLPFFSGNQFPSLDAIDQYLMEPAWVPHPMDWMIPSNAVEERKYVEKIYNAIVELRYVCDEDQRYSQFFRPGQRWSNPMEIEAVSYIVVDRALKIHQHGVVGFMFRGPESPWNKDRVFTFAQRIHFVALLLKHFKKWACEFMAQRRFEEVVARIPSILSSEEQFMTFWNGLTPEAQKKCLEKDPYEGMEAKHPDDEEMMQQMEISGPINAEALRRFEAPSAPQVSSAPVVPGNPASQQHQFQAGSSGSDQRIPQLQFIPPGQRPASGEGTQRQNLPLVYTTAPTGSRVPLQTLQSTPMETGSQFAAEQHGGYSNDSFGGFGRSNVRLNVQGFGVGDHQPPAQRRPGAPGGRLATRGGRDQPGFVSMQWQDSIAPSMNPPMADSTPQLPGPTSVAAGWALDEGTAQTDAELDRLFQAVGQPNRLSGGPGFAPFWQSPGLQSVLNALSQRSAPDQPGSYVVSEGEDEDDGGDAEGAGGRGEGEDDRS